MKKAIGILGGMGPLATLDIQQKILLATHANVDQDHCDVWVANLASIPPRAAAIEGGGPSPLLAMREGMHHLLAAGVGVIAMPCNTAHYWYDALTPDLPVPFIHIADAATRAVTAAPGSRIAVLGTSATLKLRMYQTRLAAAGWQPHDVEGIEDLVASAISEVKAGEVAAAAARLTPVLDRCFAEGAAQVVLACTELPIAAAHAALPPAARARLVDPTNALAKAAVAWWQAQPS